MDQVCCVTCEKPLRPSEVKNKLKRCEQCLARKQIAAQLAEESIDERFSHQWVQQLFRGLGAFLKQHEVPAKTQARLLSKAAILFQDADRRFRCPEDMSARWIEDRIEQAGPHFAPSFFRAYLLEEHVLMPPSKDEEQINALHAKIEGLPQGYRRLMEVYFNERISLRERQINLHAKRPLAVGTIKADWDLLSRLVRWLGEQEAGLSGWEMVQEEHIHAFLLTLTPKNREPARKDLYVFFRLARKRRILTHVPIMDAPAKELPPTVEPLDGEGQKVLARLIRAHISTQPEESFLSALCFYHALTPRQVCGLVSSDVDVERGVIHVEGRPPVYLLAEDFLLLEQFLRKRQALPYAQKRSHLVISNRSTLDDVPVPSAYVNRKVQAFTGHTPQRLRVTCLATLSARYGSHYLVEAFGLSLTQASRYGNMREFLLEEEVKQQREEWLELSRRL